MEDRKILLQHYISIDNIVESIQDGKEALDLITAIDLKMADSSFTEDVIRILVDDLCSELGVSRSELFYIIFSDKQN